MTNIERILVVDESDANSLFFQMIFKELGFDKVFTATSGHEGLEIVEKEHIQLVVVAWEMNSLPGTIFVQKARAKRKRRYMPCLIYSKRMTEHDVQLTKELGFKTVLAMPFDREKAKTMLAEMIEAENNLDQRENLLRKMEAYLAEGKPSEALKLVGPKLLKPSPYLPRAQTLMAEIWMQMGKLDRAEKSLDEALAADRACAPASQLKARLYSKMGRHDEAIALLQRMLEGSPKNMTTMVGLGSAYVTAERHEEAKEVFGRVMELDEDNQVCKDEMGKLAFKEGDMSLAAQLLAETENGDDLARFFNNMAISLVAKNDFQKGIETYHNAIRLLADKARLHLLHYNLGLACRKKGDLAASFTELARSYQQDPSYEKAYAALARVAKEMKENGLAPDKSMVMQVKSARQKFKEGQPPSNDAAAKENRKTA